VFSDIQRRFSVQFFFHNRISGGLLKVNAKKNHVVPHVEIISPSDVCSCSFSIWMNRVWDILNNYQDKIHITNLTSDSSRARALGVTGRSIVINGEEVPFFMLKNRIEDLIK